MIFRRNNCSAKKLHPKIACGKPNFQILVFPFLLLGSPQLAALFHFLNGLLRGTNVRPKNHWKNTNLCRRLFCAVNIAAKFFWKILLFQEVFCLEHQRRNNSFLLLCMCYASSTATSIHQSVHPQRQSSSSV